jgi:hypothetical protein
MTNMEREHCRSQTSLIGCLVGFVLNKAEFVTQLVLCGELSEHVVKRPTFNSSEDTFFTAVFYFI